MSKSWPAAELLKISPQHGGNAAETFGQQQMFLSDGQIGLITTKLISILDVP
jgi:hypothetical protein